MPCPPRTARIAVSDGRRTLALPAEVGDPVTLAFRHSIYGASVKEEFVVAEAGLRLVRLRYGEARVAEFYGHEDAQAEGDAWTVDGGGVLRPAIVVRASRTSEMRLRTRSTTVDLVDWIDGDDESVRVTVSAGAS